MESIKSASRLSNLFHHRSQAQVELQGSNCPWTSGCEKQRTGPSNDPITVSFILKNADGEGEVAKFAKANGLSVSSADAKTKTVKLTGTPAQFNKALGVQLGNYKSEAGIYRGYDGNVKLPKSLAANTMAVLGLDNHPIARPHFVIGKKSAKPGDMGPNGYLPTDVAALYNFPKGTDGTGQTIAIIELGGGYKDDDLNNYFKKLGIPKPNITSVGVDGGANTPAGDPNSADGEVDLDIENVGAIAPGANIKVYFAPNTDQGFIDAINQASADMGSKPGFESISWGAPEDQWSAQSRSALNDAAKAAAQKGVNIFAASGDNGSSDGESDGKDHVDFPASSPWIIGTGGTQLNSQNGKVTSEVVWNDGGMGGAGGGGFSTVFDKPDFQAKANPNAKRGVPDVAGDASPSTGYDVIADGQEFPVGGTSAVAPLWAALAAREAQAVGQPLGFLAPVLYQHPEAFNDITSGNNGTQNAGPGWDAATGLGSPDGTKLLAVLQQAAGQNPAPAPAPRFATA
ncbi:MAG: S53 family peptidase [Candidatus Xenobia bacterium]